MPTRKGEGGGVAKRGGMRKKRLSKREQKSRVERFFIFES